jgi:hypothetical protein
MSILVLMRSIVFSAIRQTMAQQTHRVIQIDVTSMVATGNIVFIADQRIPAIRTLPTIPINVTKDKQRMFGIVSHPVRIFWT